MLQYSCTEGEVLEKIDPAGSWGATRIKSPKSSKRTLTETGRGNLREVGEKRCTAGHDEEKKDSEGWQTIEYGSRKH